MEFMPCCGLCGSTFRDCGGTVNRAKLHLLLNPPKPKKRKKKKR
jgi:hypothetical protein